MNVSYKLKPYQTKDGTKVGKIFLRVRNDSSKLDLLFKTGIQIAPDYWDASVPGYKDSTPIEVLSSQEVKQVNEQLQQLIVCIRTNCTDESSKEAIERTISIFMQTTKEDKSTERTKNKRTKAILDKVEQSQDNKDATARLTAIGYFKRYL